MDPVRRIIFFFVFFFILFSICHCADGAICAAHYRSQNISSPNNSSSYSCLSGPKLSFKRMRQTPISDKVSFVDYNLTISTIIWPFNNQSRYEQAFLNSISCDLAPPDSNHTTIPTQLYLIPDFCRDEQARLRMFILFNFNSKEFLLKSEISQVNVSLSEFIFEWKQDGTLRVLLVDEANKQTTVVAATSSGGGLTKLDTQLEAEYCFDAEACQFINRLVKQKANKSHPSSR